MCIYIYIFIIVHCIYIYRKPKELVGVEWDLTFISLFLFSKFIRFVNQNDISVTNKIALAGA